MDLDSYLKLLEKQRKILTKEQLTAIEEQQRLQNIADQKMQERDELEEQYVDLYTIGCEKLNLKVAKAYFDFFVANAELNKRIENDRKILFSSEYKDKIRQSYENGYFKAFNRKRLFMFNKSPFAKLETSFIIPLLPSTEEYRK